MSLFQALQQVVNRENLTAAEAETVMDLILTGQTTSAQIAALLVALRMKGEAPDEILGFARAVRSRAIPVRPNTKGQPLVDTCGTGGDGACTFNISTVAALVVAGAGIKVAKHGNRSVSSKCGSADILEELGVTIELPPDDIALCIEQTNFGFLFAPAIHPSFRHAQQARTEIKLRTAFNFLGPLVNPARATVQVAGAPTIQAAELMAQTLASFGLSRGFVVHGMDGLDEITTVTESLVLEIRGGAIAHHTVTPEDFGISRARPSDLAGNSREENSLIANRILNGVKGPARDIVLVNASAAIVAAGVAADFTSGVQIAAESIDSGAARRTLDRVVAFTKAPSALNKQFTA